MINRIGVPQTMDHHKAINGQYADRYLLKELSPADAEEFEGHYFECEECASAVERGDIFIANARAVLRESKPEPFRGQSHHLKKARLSWLWNAITLWTVKPAVFFPAAACLVLAALAFYQGAVVIPGLREIAGNARILPAFQLLGASRGEESQIVVPAGASSFAVSADIPPDVHFQTYVCEVSRGGAVVFQLSTAAPAEGEPITILLPVKGLSAGEYALSIFGSATGGQPKEKVITFSFGLRFH